MHKRIFVEDFNAKFKVVEYNFTNKRNSSISDFTTKYCRCFIIEVEALSTFYIPDKQSTTDRKYNRSNHQFNPTY